MQLRKRSGVKDLRVQRPLFRDHRHGGFVGPFLVIVYRGALVGGKHIILAANGYVRNAVGLAQTAYGHVFDINFAIALHIHGKAGLGVIRLAQRKNIRYLFGGDIHAGQGIVLLQAHPGHPGIFTYRDVLRFQCLVERRYSNAADARLHQRRRIQALKAKHVQLH